MPISKSALDQLCINAIRVLSIDAVEKAKSGHPGMPMGSAAMTYVLWTRFLRHNPENPKWPNRDRFVLSAGHGSMLLYSLLHLTGYDLPLDELENFRQWGSRTPGHPEHDRAPGVETTTGPLGQGFGNGIGMAIAEKFLAAYFNRPGHEIVDYHIYAIVSDGDLMEGVSSEAASLAGHLRLGNIIYLYDDNHISIEGNTELAFSEDVGRRFEAYGWHIQTVNGNSLDSVSEAISIALAQTNRPSLIRARTHIGFGSPNKQDTPGVHGAPLGEDEVRLTKQNLNWPVEPTFHIPEEALARFREAIDRGLQLEKEWQARFDAYAAEFPDKAEEWKILSSGQLPEGWTENLPQFQAEAAPMATREASGKVLNAIASTLPTLIGGSADLAPSTETYLKGFGDFSASNYSARNMHFGVREHAMGSILNGIALTEGLIPFGGTFLIFSDYMRPAIRLAAMMHQRVIYVFTHDSIGLGEDGPTHQPIEQLAALRAIPHLIVLRPSDATETVAAWQFAIEYREGPVALVLSRQKLPIIDRTKLASADNLAKGAYIIAEAPNEKVDVILIATGSEVQLAIKAHEQLAGEGIGARVVSMPSWELFDEQPREYRDHVLPPHVTARIAIETAGPQGWHKYVGTSGDMLVIPGFGASAPVNVLLEKFGFTVENIVQRTKVLLHR